MRKGPALLTAVAATVGLIGFSVVPGAGASSHASYPLGKAKSCRADYHKHVRDRIVAARVKVDGTWKVEHKKVRYVECVYVAPKKPAPPTTTTTTTTPPVTTTTEPQIFDQAVNLLYDAFLSYYGSGYAHEWAELTIGLYPALSPGGGTVSFYDANDDFICQVTVPMFPIILNTVVGCTNLTALATAPPTPLRVIYSGTQNGYDDGYGTSYAGAIAYGEAD